MWWSGGGDGASRARVCARASQGESGAAALLRRGLQAQAQTAGRASSAPTCAWRHMTGSLLHMTSISMSAALTPCFNGLLLAIVSHSNTHSQ